MSERHNFNKPENKERANYRLWMLLTPEGRKHFKSGETFVMFSYFPNDPPRGLKRLKENAWKYNQRLLFKYARIYDKQNNVVEQIQGLTTPKLNDKHKRPRKKIIAYAKVPVASSND